MCQLLIYCLLAPNSLLLLALGKWIWALYFSLPAVTKALPAEDTKETQEGFGSWIWCAYSEGCCSTSTFSSRQLLQGKAGRGIQWPEELPESSELFYSVTSLVKHPWIIFHSTLQGRFLSSSRGWISNWNATTAPSLVFSEPWLGFLQKDLDFSSGLRVALPGHSVSAVGVGVELLCISAISIFLCALESILPAGQ